LSQFTLLGQYLNDIHIGSYWKVCKFRGISTVVNNFHFVIILFCDHSNWLPRIGPIIRFGKGHGRACTSYLWLYTCRVRFMDSSLSFNCSIIIYHRHSNHYGTWRKLVSSSSSPPANYLWSIMHGITTSFIYP